MFKKQILALATMSLLGMSTSSQAAILPIDDAKQYFDQPYLEFAKKWMKESAVEKGFGFLGAIIGMKALNLDQSEGLTRRFEYEDMRTVNRAQDTFKAYCDFNTGTTQTLKNEISCTKSDKVLGTMHWMYTAQPHDKVTFVHQGGQAAQVRFDQLKKLSPGDSLNTKYGSGIVIETKEGGLIFFQPERGQARWITSADVFE